MPRPSRSRLPIVLAVGFLLVMVSGPGPGMRLVNPGPEDAGTWFGVPRLYVWAWAHFVLLAAILLVAERRIWSRREDPDFEEACLLEDADSPGALDRERSE